MHCVNQTNLVVELDTLHMNSLGLRHTLPHFASGNGAQSPGSGIFMNVYADSGWWSTSAATLRINGLGVSLQRGVRIVRPDDVPFSTALAF